MQQSRTTCEASGQPSRRFRSFEYQTRESWSCPRRVVAKAEWLPGPRGYNARFVVTNYREDVYDARTVYEDVYCARGEPAQGAAAVFGETVTFWVFRVPRRIVEEYPSIALDGHIRTASYDRSNRIQRTLTPYL